MQEKINTVGNAFDIGILFPGGLLVAVGQWYGEITLITDPLLAFFVTLAAFILLYYRIRMARVKLKIAEEKLHQMERENAAPLEPEGG